jgi:predicted Fe-Mo cluster-binding NifX family protein
MKIVITSRGNNIQAKIDSQFARCAYFALYDTDTREISFIKNLCRTLENNVGLAVVENIHDMGVKRIISGEFGLKAKNELDKHAIQMVVITDHERTIKEIIELLESGHS